MIPDDPFLHPGLVSLQWLPTNVDFTDTGMKITSYVNNLHPGEHRALYDVLGQFVNAAVPLSEENVSWFSDRRRQIIQHTDERAGLRYP